MRVTLEEIARLAGVSKATVSRVLNDIPEGVGPETRARVKAVIKHLGYDLDGFNVHGRQDVHSHNIGLILPDIANPFFSELAREISRAAIDNGYVVMLGSTDFSVKVEQRIIAAFTAKKVDGVILVSVGGECCEGHRLLERYKIPCLLLDRDVSDMKRDALIVADNEQVSYTCCEMLISHGSFDVAYITGSSGASTSDERLRGYRRALQRFSVPYVPERIKNGNYTMESGYNAVLEMERAGTRYSAIMAANDLMAMGAMKALQEFGYNIPGDVEVIGFDNIVYSQYTEPTLTTVQQPTIEMGQLAVRTIIDIIEGKKEVARFARLRPKILSRKSTR